MGSAGDSTGALAGISAWAGASAMASAGPSAGVSAGTSAGASPGASSRSSRPYSKLMLHLRGIASISSDDPLAKCIQISVYRKFEVKRTWFHWIVVRIPVDLFDRLLFEGNDIFSRGYIVRFDGFGRIW